jgi:hypothetical protein
LGEWKTTDIAAHTTGFADSLLITVGCHAGLSVPNALGNLADTDIAQSFLAKGGAMIGTSAYAYASRLKASYSEELAIALTKEIIAGSSQPIGIALNRAKARYYSENAGWIDALDEKVLLPTTLYGLPMLEVSTTNGSALAISLLAASAPSPVVATEQMIAGPAQSDYVKMPLDNVIDPALYQLSSDGTYYTYAGNALLQEGAPIQPSHQIVPTITVGGHKIRAVLLRGASYEEKDFAPAIAESFVISAGPTQTRRNAKALFMETETGWDRAFPHSLGYADRLNNSAAPSDIVSVNLVLGAYNVTDGRYRHFTDLDLELLYSDSPDRDDPKAIDATGLVSTAQTQLTANVDANETIAEVIGLCDNGIDTYAVVDLQRQEGGQWRGICAMSATRFFLQVVDTAGNVTITDWQRTEAGTIGQDFALYLPFIAK